MTAFDSIVPIASITSVLALLWLLYSLWRRKLFLQPDKFNSAPLIEKETVTYNTSRYRFAIGNNVKLGLPVGQHISFKFIDDSGREVMRPYTPVTGNDTLGHVDFVIKTYPQGKMSQHVDKLGINDRILMRGPKGRFQYHCGMKRTFGMVAGGTGITPMYQVMREIAHNPQDSTEIWLVFANVTMQDILLKDELDDLAKQHPTQVHVTYVLDDAPEGWTGETGYVTGSMIKAHCPAPADDAMLLFCGPRPMTKSLEAAAKEVGYSQDQTFTF